MVMKQLKNNTEKRLYGFKCKECNRVSFRGNNAQLYCWSCQIQRHNLLKHGEGEKLRVCLMCGKGILIFPKKRKYRLCQSCRIKKYASDTNTKFKSLSEKEQYKTMNKRARELLNGTR